MGSAEFGPATLRHVKAGDLAFENAFSRLSGLLFGVGEITTRKASEAS